MISRLACLLSVALLGSPLMAHAIDKGKESQAEDVIASLKAYPASKILPGYADAPPRELPNIPLEKWLKSAVGDTPLEWGGGDCASHDSEIDGCSSFVVFVNTPNGRCPSISLRFVIRHDTTVYLMASESAVNAFGASGSLEQLADVETVLKKAQTGPVRPSSLTVDRLRARKAKDIEAYVRGLDVHEFDPSLPSERFDKWVERIAGWPLLWGTTAVGNRCNYNELDVHVLPLEVGNLESHLLLSFHISVKLGLWEEEIKDKPTLDISSYGGRLVRDFPEYYGTDFLNKPKSLSELKNKIDYWRAGPKLKPLVDPNPVVRGDTLKWPAYKPTLPVVQNMTHLGDFSKSWSTPTGHCYGYDLVLWKYGERVFGTLYNVGGQCADGREPTYVVRDVKLDTKTGELEFWSKGTPGYKFVGKMDQDMVIGKFVGGHEELKLMRNKGQSGPLNVEAWCKDYATTFPYVVKNEVEELCKSLGVQ